MYTNTIPYNVHISNARVVCVSAKLSALQSLGEIKKSGWAAARGGALTVISQARGPRSRLLNCEAGTIFCFGAQASLQTAMSVGWYLFIDVGACQSFYVMLSGSLRSNFHPPFVTRSSDNTGDTVTVEFSVLYTISTFIFIWQNKIGVQ